MGIVVNCRCGGKFQAKDELAGKRLNCPNCKAAIVVPSKQKTQPAARSTNSLAVKCRCGKAYQVPPTMAGKSAKCQSCGAVIQVPANRAAQQRPAQQASAPAPQDDIFNDLLADSSQSAPLPAGGNVTRPFHHSGSGGGGKSNVFLIVAVAGGVVALLLVLVCGIGGYAVYSSLTNEPVAMNSDGDDDSTPTTDNTDDGAPSVVDGTAFQPSDTDDGSPADGAENENTDGVVAPVTPPETSDDGGEEPQNDPVAVDESMTVEEWNNKGMPDVSKIDDRTELFKVTIEFVNMNLHHYEKLPRKNSERSGPIFAQIVSGEHIRRMGDPSRPLAERIQTGAAWLLFLGKIGDAYKLSRSQHYKQDNDLFTDEITAIVVVGIRTMVASAKLVNEFAPSAEKEQQALLNEDRQYIEAMRASEELERYFDDPVSLASSIVESRSLKVHDYPEEDLALIRKETEAALPVITPYLTDTGLRHARTVIQE